MANAVLNRPRAPASGGRRLATHGAPPRERPKPASAGAQGSASLGVGAGGNVLVGGSNNSIALQPLSLQGQVGINIAAGLESLELRPGR